MRGPAPRLRNRRGASLLVVAFGLAAVLGMLALTIDLGMLFAARTEAQRAADAAALAGASAYIDHVDPNPADSAARDRALAYAARHRIRGDSVIAGEVEIETIPDSFKVRVRVSRPGIPLWFAHVLGIERSDVAATAAAAATAAGGAKCVKPFAVPDLWYNADDDNQIWEVDEQWSFDASRGDYYARYGDGPSQTGYGSTFRDGVPDVEGRTFQKDYGRPAFMKITNPQNTTESSVFFPWVMPEDDDAAESCEHSGGGGPGAAAYRRNICGCNDATIELETDYEIQTGNMVGPTHQGVRSLIERDPDAYWDEQGDTVAGSAFSTWRSSPRVIKIALYDPVQIQSPGKQSIRFNNFGLFFIESQNSPQDPVLGRFLYYASGTGEASGDEAGTLVRVLRLVE